MTTSQALNADLHCHSVVSDGTLTPEALAARAAANGVALWALTDHDEIGGQHRARAAAHAQGMRYLTGTEISVTFAGKTVHIVGLGQFRNIPNSSLVNAAITDAKLAHASLGVRWHLSERFTARLDWTLYTAFVADTRSTEYRSLTAGLGFYF